MVQFTVYQEIILKINKVDFLNLPGVYLLICENDLDSKKQVYIGESENVFNRLKNHLSKYERNEIDYYWNHCYVFMSNDFDKASVRYIEKKFFDLALKANRYDVLTEKTTTNLVTSKFKEIEYKEYIKNALMILNMLNIDIFRVIEDKDINHINNLNNNIKNGKDSNFNDSKYVKIRSNKANAYGYQSSNGFVVLKGSTISKNVTKTFDIYYKQKNILRNELIERKVIVNNQFTINYEFTSPSAAFIVITGMGTGSAGLNSWKFVNEVNLSNSKIKENTQEDEDRINDMTQQSKEIPISSSNDIKYMKIRSNKANAYGYQSSNGFVVLKGSTISENVGKTFETLHKSKRKQRDQLIKEGIIVNNTFTRDYEFKSASSAFIFIVGAATNFAGLDSWKYVDKVEI